MTTIATETSTDAPTKIHGALWPRLNAPPGFVVNRSSSTPGITLIGGRPGERVLDPELREPVEEPDVPATPKSTPAERAWRVTVPTAATAPGRP